MCTSQTERQTDADQTGVMYLLSLSEYDSLGDQGPFQLASHCYRSDCLGDDPSIPRTVSTCRGSLGTGRLVRQLGVMDRAQLSR
jgi:hypothetical protein